jgi:hypoxanthine phosphoribosyltransferase
MLSGMAVSRKRVTESKKRKPKAVVTDVYGAAGGAQIVSKEALGIDRSNRKGSTRELSWAEFDRHVQAIARASHKTFKPNAVVGIAHGGVFVGGAIASALKVDFYPVRITRRSRDLGRRTTPGLSEDMPKELKGKRVLLVDDVAGSGDGLEMARRLAKAAGATKLATAALIARPAGFAPDFVAFTDDTFFVFPWDYQAVVEDARFDPDLAGA